MALTVEPTGLLGAAQAAHVPIVDSRATTVAATNKRREEIICMSLEEINHTEIDINTSPGDGLRYEGSISQLSEVLDCSALTKYSFHAPEDEKPESSYCRVALIGIEPRGHLRLPLFPQLLFALFLLWFDIS